MIAPAAITESRPMLTPGSQALGPSGGRTDAAERSTCDPARLTAIVDGRRAVALSSYGLEELQAIAERIVRVDAAKAGEVAVPADVLPCAPKPFGDSVDVADKDSGMSFAGGSEVVFDTEV
jgi:hypothetical protein